jgi:hypothetical protein
MYLSELVIQEKINVEAFLEHPVIGGMLILSGLFVHCLLYFYV